MLTGTFNLCGSLLAPLLVYRFRRRLLMLISLGICALALFGMSFSLFFMMRSADRALPYVSIVIILIFILGFQLGLGPIPYFIGSGLYGGEGIISGVVFLMCIFYTCRASRGCSASYCYVYGQSMFVDWQFPYRNVLSFIENLLELVRLHALLPRVRRVLSSRLALPSRDTRTTAPGC